MDFQTPKTDVALGYVHEPTGFRDSKFPYANGSKKLRGKYPVPQDQGLSQPRGPLPAQLGRRVSPYVQIWPRGFRIDARVLTPILPSNVLLCDMELMKSLLLVGKIIVLTISVHPSGTSA